MIDKKYYQLQLGEEFIRDSIDDGWEPWMRVADEILDGEEHETNRRSRIPPINTALPG